MSETKKVYCDFCNRSADEVSSIVKSDHAGICNDCILLCVETLIKRTYTVTLKNPNARAKEEPQS